MALVAEAQRGRERTELDRFQARRKQQDAIEKARAKGVFLIGPPNPHRFKKFRPPMKS